MASTKAGTVDRGRSDSEGAREAPSELSGYEVRGGGTRNGVWQAPQALRPKSLTMS